MTIFGYLYAMIIIQHFLIWLVVKVDLYSAVAMRLWDHGTCLHILKKEIAPKYVHHTLYIY